MNVTFFENFSDDGKRLCIKIMAEPVNGSIIFAEMEEILPSPYYHLGAGRLIEIHEALLRHVNTVVGQAA